MSQLKPSDEALWAAYWADRTSRNCNAIFEFHWKTVLGWVARYLHRNRLSTLSGTVLSYVEERILSKAIPRFDPDCGASFRTYLRHNVVGAIRTALRAEDTLTHQQRKVRNAIHSAREHLGHILAHRPNDFEVAEYLGIPESQVIEAQQMHDYQGLWAENIVIPDDPSRDVRYQRMIQLAAPETTNQKEWFEHLTAGLKPKHRRMLWLYYIENRTEQEIGAIMGVSAATVSLHMKASRQFLKKNRAWRDVQCDIR